jgi:hypothetical protein
MTYGYPGQASRQGDEVSRTRPVAAGAADIPFGAPVVQKEDGSVAIFGATNTAADFAGIAMRKVKSAKVYPYQNFGYYAAGEACDVLQRGGVSAKCAWGAPKVGAKVYVRTKVVGGTSPAGAQVGDLGAVNEAGNCVELTGVKWSSGADARGVAELTIIDRQGV